jgi:(p)ppGpp synthase/HD superfamily hydrolase
MMIEHGIKHSRSQKLINFACRFAEEAHGDQKRKYTGEPYILHPIGVAQIVATVTNDCETIAAAFLHDTVEDTDVTYSQIVEAGFGHGIAQLVIEVTDVSTPKAGNRKYRKEMDRKHLAMASKRGKTIKLADLIHNTSSICKYDERFARVYMQEKKELLDVLRDGDSTLYARARKIVDEYYSAES